MANGPRGLALNARPCHQAICDRSRRDGESPVTYNRWYGQHLLDRLHVETAYPLSFGHSYTTFAVKEVQAERSGKEVLLFTVVVQNAGSQAGRFVVQMYGSSDVPQRPKRLLLGFGVLDLEAGEQKNATVEGSIRPLQKWENGTWHLTTDEVTVEVGNYYDDQNAVRVDLKL